MASAAGSKGKVVSEGSNTTYLKVGLLMLNEDLNPNDKKYTLKDLEKPTPRLVQGIFLAALTRIQGRPIVAQTAPMPLERFNRLGIGNVVYDAGVDNLYHHLLPCFPGSTGMLDYSILLAPLTDIKRTHNAICYVVAYALFCDSIVEHFDKVTAELNEENNLKTDLCTEIENIRDKCQAIEERQKEAEMEIPKLEFHVQGVKDVIKCVEGEIDDISNHMAKDKVIYSQVQTSIKVLEQKGLQLEQQKKSLEDQIIDSPEELRNAFENRKKEVEDLKTTQRQLSEALVRVVDNDQLIDSSTDMGMKSINAFEDLISKMMDEEGKVKHVSQVANVIFNLDKEIRLIENENSELVTSLEKVSKECDEKRRSHEAKVTENKQHRRELERLKEEIEFERKQMLAHIIGYKNEINDTVTKCKDLKSRNDESEKYITVVIESMRQKLMENYLKKIDQFNEFASLE